MSIAKLARGLAGLSVLGVIVLSSQACVEAEGNFFIRQAGPVADACGEQSSEIEVPVGPVVDLEGTVIGQQNVFAVMAGVCVVNQLKSRTDNGIESANILFYQYDVALDGGGSATRPTSGGVEAAGDDQNAGFSVSNVTLPVVLMSGDSLVDLSTGLDDGDSVESVAAIKLYGRTTGGIDLETPDFYLPILITNSVVTCTCDDGAQYPCPPDQCT